MLFLSGAMVTVGCQVSVTWGALVVEYHLLTLQTINISDGNTVDSIIYLFIFHYEAAAIFEGAQKE